MLLVWCFVIVIVRYCICCFVISLLFDDWFSCFSLVVCGLDEIGLVCWPVDCVAGSGLGDACWVLLLVVSMIAGGGL